MSLTNHWEHDIFLKTRFFLILNKDIGNTGNYREKTKPYLTPQLTLIGTRQFWRTYVLEKNAKYIWTPKKDCTKWKINPTSTLFKMSNSFLQKDDVYATFQGYGFSQKYYTLFWQNLWPRHCINDGSTMSCTQTLSKI